MAAALLSRFVSQACRDFHSAYRRSPQAEHQCVEKDWTFVSPQSLIVRLTFEASSAEHLTVNVGDRVLLQFARLVDGTQEVYAQREELSAQNDGIGTEQDFHSCEGWIPVSCVDLAEHEGRLCDIFESLALQDNPRDPCPTGIGHQIAAHKIINCIRLRALIAKERGREARDREKDAENRCRSHEAKIALLGAQLASADAKARCYQKEVESSATKYASALKSATSKYEVKAKECDNLVQICGERDEALIKLRQIVDEADKVAERGFQHSQMVTRLKLEVQSYKDAWQEVEGRLELSYQENDELKEEVRILRAEAEKKEGEAIRYAELQGDLAKQCHDLKRYADADWLLKDSYPALHRTIWRRLEGDLKILPQKADVTRTMPVLALRWCQSTIKSDMTFSDGSSIFFALQKLLQGSMSMDDWRRDHRGRQDPIDVVEYKDRLFAVTGNRRLAVACMYQALNRQEVVEIPCRIQSLENEFWYSKCFGQSASSSHGPQFTTECWGMNIGFGRCPAKHYGSDLFPRDRDDQWLLH